MQSIASLTKEINDNFRIHLLIKTKARCYGLLVFIVP